MTLLEVFEHIALLDVDQAKNIWMTLLSFYERKSDSMFSLMSSTEI
jgi:hypothetical protein